MSYDDTISRANSRLIGNEKRVYLAATDFAADETAPFASLVKKDSKKTNEPHWGVRLSKGAGVSFGSIGEAAGKHIVQAKTEMKHMYQRVSFDRYTLDINVGNDSSFTNLLKESLMDARHERNRQLERILIRGDSTGELGTIGTSGVTDNGGGNYTLTITAASWASGVWSPEQLLNIGASGTSIFVVQNIDLDERKVTVQRRSGADIPADADKLYLQKSKDKEPLGLKEIIEGAGTLFGITRQFGWESTIMDRGGKPLTPLSLVEFLEKIRQRCDRYPDLLLVPYTQMQRIHQIAENGVIKTVSANAKRVSAGGKAFTVSVPGILEVQIGGRTLKMISTPMLEQSKIYAVNLDHISMLTVGPGKFVPQTGGNMLLYVGAISGEDAYEAIWYQDFLIKGHPSYHGAMINLATNTETGVSY